MAKIHITIVIVVIVAISAAVVLGRTLQGSYNTDTHSITATVNPPTPPAPPVSALVMKASTAEGTDRLATIPEGEQVLMEGSHFKGNGTPDTDTVKVIPRTAVGSNNTAVNPSCARINTITLDHTSVEKLDNLARTQPCDTVVMKNGSKFIGTGRPDSSVVAPYVNPTANLSK